MSSDNPFEVSSDSYGDRSGADRDASAAEVSARSIEMLNQTRPWVQLIGILMWIATVLMAIASLGIVGASLVGGEAIAGLLMGGLYFIFVLIYGTLAKSLTGYAKSINHLNSSESVIDLENALEAQKTFWRLAGIITLVTIVLYLLLIVAMLAGATFLGGLMGR